MKTQAFNGDYYLLKECLSLKKKYGCEIAIETGTHIGYTTAEMAKHFSRVHTIESKNEHYKRAIEYCRDKSNFGRITFHLGTSQKVLPKILSREEIQGNILFYLDGHWEKEPSPLLKELEIISMFDIKPILIIHDFKVPGHPELGYDTYDGQEYEWGWISRSVEKIYKNDYLVYYNTKVPEEILHKRGCLFVVPI